MDPQMMTNKGNLLIINGIEQISSPNKWIIFVIVHVHSIDGSRLILSIDSDSLVYAALIKAHPEEDGPVAVSSLDDFDGVGVDLANSADCPLGAFVMSVNGVICALKPVNVVHMMFGDNIFIVFKPEACHLAFLFN